MLVLNISQFWGAAFVLTAIISAVSFKIIQTFCINDKMQKTYLWLTLSETVEACQSVPLHRKSTHAIAWWRPAVPTTRSRRCDHQLRDYKYNYVARQTIGDPFKHIPRWIIIFMTVFVFIGMWSKIRRTNLNDVSAARQMFWCKCNWKWNKCYLLATELKPVIPRHLT